uniref:Uncharacterized protein n=1 Tax=Arundo donax TaxID=35708 RepID=A0A0A9E167_ARUDO
MKPKPMHIQTFLKKTDCFLLLPLDCLHRDFESYHLFLVSNLCVYLCSRVCRSS